MKRWVTCLAMALVLVSTNAVSALAATQLEIPIGKTRRDRETKVQVRFVAVVEDSRCPLGAQCIQAGNARIAIDARRARGAWQSFDLNTAKDPLVVELDGVALRIVDLSPLPTLDQPPKTKRDRVLLSLEAH